MKTTGEIIKTIENIAPLLSEVQQLQIAQFITAEYFEGYHAGTEKAVEILTRTTEEMNVIPEYMNAAIAEGVENES